jgi:hypothetical protein
MNSVKISDFSISKKMSSSAAPEEQKSPEEWTRSDNFQTDLLHLWQHSEFYDCTFQVTSKEADENKVLHSLNPHMHYLHTKIRLGIQVPQAGAVRLELRVCQNVLWALQRSSSGCGRTHSAERNHLRSLRMRHEVFILSEIQC